MKCGRASSAARSSGRASGRDRSTQRGAKITAALITDPFALLAALETGERAEEAKRAEAEMRLVEACEKQARVAEMRAVEPGPVTSLEAQEEAATAEAGQVPEPTESGRLPLPVLREDERVGHASEAGVVVVIRRRRAA